MIKEYKKYLANPKQLRDAFAKWRIITLQNKFSQDSLLPNNSQHELQFLQTLDFYTQFKEKVFKRLLNSQVTFSYFFLMSSQNYPLLVLRLLFLTENSLKRKSLREN